MKVRFRYGMLDKPADGDYRPLGRVECVNEEPSGGRRRSPRLLDRKMRMMQAERLRLFALGDWQSRDCAGHTEGMRRLLRLKRVAAEMNQEALTLCRAFVDSGASNHWNRWNMFAVKINVDDGVFAVDGTTGLLHQEALRGLRLLKKRARQLRSMACVCYCEVRHFAADQEQASRNAYRHCEALGRQFDSLIDRAILAGTEKEATAPITVVCPFFSESEDSDG